MNANLNVFKCSMATGFNVVDDFIFTNFPLNYMIITVETAHAMDYIPDQFGWQ